MSSWETTVFNGWGHQQPCACSKCSPRVETTRKEEKRVTKIWHCGHGGDDGTWGPKNHQRCIANNTCFILHGKPEHLTGPGTNTSRQFKNFTQNSREGDIIFSHCNGVLTHYGFYTGEVFMEEVRDNHGDIVHVESEIAVYEWFPLPEGLGGAGLPPTLYEVTPTTNGGKPTRNYQNYSILS